MAGISDAAKTGRGASAVTANLRRSGGPEPAVSCHGGSERAAPAAGPKGKNEAAVISFRRKDIGQAWDRRLANWHRVPQPKPIPKSV